MDGKIYYIYFCNKNEQDVIDIINDKKFNSGWIYYFQSIEECINYSYEYLSDDSIVFSFVITKKRRLYYIF